MPSVGRSSRRGQGIPIGKDVPTLEGMHDVPSGLRDARLAAGLSQGRLAERANVEVERVTGKPGALDGNAISRMERGVIRWPAQRNLDALCAILGASPAELGFESRGAVLAPVDWAIDRQAASPETLDALATILDGLRRLEDQAGPRVVLPVVEHHARTSDLLAREARLTLRPAALELLNELVLYRGWLRFAVDDPSGARRDFDIGLGVAVEADSSTGIADSLSFKGYVDMHQDAALSAASLTTAANRYERVPINRRFFHLLSARCLAMAGELTDSDKELLAADRVKVTDVTLNGRNYWYTDAWMTVQRGLVHAKAGRTRAALMDIEDGLAGMPAEHRSADWVRRYEDVRDELLSA